MLEVGDEVGKRAGAAGAQSPSLVSLSTSANTVWRNKDNKVAVIGPDFTIAQRRDTTISSPLTTGNQWTEKQRYGYTELTAGYQLRRKVHRGV